MVEQGVPQEVKVCVDHAIRAFASRCLSHPRLDDSPAPVIVNERDKMLDEIWRDEPSQETTKWATPELKKEHRNGRKK